jgi:hypothetical protein
LEQVRGYTEDARGLPTVALAWQRASPYCQQDKWDAAKFPCVIHHRHNPSETTKNEMVSLKYRLYKMRKIIREEAYVLDIFTLWKLILWTSINYVRSNTKALLEDGKKFCLEINEKETKFPNVLLRHKIAGRSSNFKIGNTPFRIVADLKYFRKAKQIKIM